MADDIASHLSEYLEGNARMQGFGNPKFQGTLLRFLNENPYGVGITSLDRDKAQQAALYARYQAQGGAPVAPPGRSNHNHGVAADISYEDDNARKWAHDNAAAYGLRFPMNNEPWHVEPIEARGGAMQNRSLPTMASGMNAQPAPGAMTLPAEAANAGAPDGQTAGSAAYAGQIGSAPLIAREIDDPFTTAAKALEAQMMRPGPQVTKQPFRPTNLSRPLALG